MTSKERANRDMSPFVKPGVNVRTNRSAFGRTYRFSPAFSTTVFNGVLASPRCWEPKPLRPPMAATGKNE